MQGPDEIVSWSASGLTFIVFDTDLATELLPKYFKQVLQAQAA